MKEYVELLEKLIRCRAVSDDIPAVNRATMILHDFLAGHGLCCKLEESADGRKILYAAPDGTKTPDYLCNAHIDVVPAPEAMYMPEIRGARIYGRGSSDCQGCVTAIARALVLAGKNGRGGAFFSADEEIGGATTGEMIRLGYRPKKLAVVVDASAWSIACAQKGILNVRLVAHGRAGHASEPWAFDNALDRLIDGYVKIRAAWPEMSAAVWGDSMAATICQAGSVSNRIPEIAEMTLNIRYTEPEGENRILDFLRETSGLEVVKEMLYCPPVVCDPENPEIVLLRRTMERSFGREIGLCRMCGATDARWFPPETPTAIIGIEGEGCHSDSEWADLESIRLYSEMLAALFA